MEPAPDPGPEAWAITTGSSSTVVSIHDDGVDFTHPDLYLNIWLNQKEIPFKVGKKGLLDSDGDGLITFWDLNARYADGTLANGQFVSDRNGTGYIDGGDLLDDPRWEDGRDQGDNGYVDDLIGWDFVQNDNTPLGIGSHGTFIAGIIGANANNGGIAGLNWRVQMMAIKSSLSSGFVPDEAVIPGVYYAADNGARISNHSYSDSFTGTGPSAPDAQAYSRAVDYAQAKGQLFVVAAGNATLNVDVDPVLPAAYPQSNIITVAATGSNNLDVPAWLLDPSQNDQLSYFSNYGKTTVDLAAPGWDLLSYASIIEELYYQYATVRNVYVGDGTSYAAPQVAGAAALLLAYNPKLTATQLKSLIMNNVDPLPTLTETTVTGGRLNVYKALAAAPAPKVKPVKLKASGFSKVEISGSPKHLPSLDARSPRATNVVGPSAGTGSAASTGSRFLLTTRDRSDPAAAADDPRDRTSLPRSVLPS